MLGIRRPGQLCRICTPHSPSDGAGAKSPRNRPVAASPHGHRARIEPLRTISFGVSQGKENFSLRVAGITTNLFCLGRRGFGLPCGSFWQGFWPLDRHGILTIIGVTENTTRATASQLRLQGRCSPSPPMPHSPGIGEAVHGSRHLEHDRHPRREIAKRLEQGPRVSYLRDWVYGGIDGTVTTFAVVAGVTGASPSPRHSSSSAWPTFSPTASPWPPPTTPAARPRLRNTASARRRGGAPCRRDHARGRARGGPADLSGQGLRGRRARKRRQRHHRGEGALDRDHDDGGARPAPDQPPAGKGRTCPHLPLLYCLRLDPAHTFCIRAPRHHPGLHAHDRHDLSSPSARCGAAGHRTWWRSGLETFAIGMSAATIAYVVGVLLGGVIQ